jgi:hypothetical protein
MATVAYRHVQRAAIPFKHAGLELCQRPWAAMLTKIIQEAQPCVN